MKVGFVFTNYNNSEYSEKLVDSLSFTKSPIVIVDNNSDKKNISILNELAQKNKNVYLQLNKTNLGYFGGLNKGIKFLRTLDKEFDYIVVGNNDLLFSSDFCNAIHQKKELFKKYPVVSPDIITPEGLHQNPHVIKRISIFREMLYDIYYSYYTFAKVINFISEKSAFFTDRVDENYHEIPQKIYQGYGACYILGPLFFLNYKELFAPTFLMGEELFLSVQLKQKGYKVFYEPSIKVIHYGHSSVSKIPNKKMWKTAKNAHKEYRKHVKFSNLYKL